MLLRTMLRRPDLLADAELNESDRTTLARLADETRRSETHT
jgi:tRNA G37 N-methylase TrmD